MKKHRLNKANSTTANAQFQKYVKPPKLLHGVNMQDNNELSMSNMGHDLTGMMLTPQKLYSIWQNASNGDPSDQVALFNSILDRDGFIASLVSTRKKSVRNKKWSVIGANEAKREYIEQVLREVKDVYASANPDDEMENYWTPGGNLIGFSFDKMLSFLMDKPFIGYAGVKIDFGAGGEYINTFMPVAHENWRFTDNWGVYIQPAAGTPVYLNGNKRFEYVLHMGSSEGRYGIPPVTGLCRPISFMYFRKSYAEMHESRLLEKFGIPSVVAKVSPTDFSNPEQRALIERQLKNLAADGAMVVNKDSEVKLEGVGAVNNATIFQSVIEYLDKSLAVTILGQQASTQATGGFSNGQIQENVRMDIMSADCKELEETVTNQIVRVIEQNKWGTQECSFKIDYESMSDIEKISKISDIVQKSGFEIDEDHMRKSFSVPINKKKREVMPTGIADILGTGAQQQATGAEQGQMNALSTQPSAGMEQPATPDGTAIPATTAPDMANPEEALASLGQAALNDTMVKIKSQRVAFADISKDVIINDYLSSMVNYSNIDDKLKKRLLYNMPVGYIQAMKYLNDRLANAILAEDGDSDAINDLRLAIASLKPDSIYNSIAKDIPANYNAPSSVPAQANEVVQNSAVEQASAQPERLYMNDGGGGFSFTDTTLGETAPEVGGSSNAVSVDEEKIAQSLMGNVTPVVDSRNIPLTMAPIADKLQHISQSIEEQKKRINAQVSTLAKKVKAEEARRNQLIQEAVAPIEIKPDIPGFISIPKPNVTTPAELQKPIDTAKLEEEAFNENYAMLSSEVAELALQHHYKQNTDMTIDILVSAYMKEHSQGFLLFPKIKSDMQAVYDNMSDLYKKEEGLLTLAEDTVEKNMMVLPARKYSMEQLRVMKTAITYWFNQRSLLDKGSDRIEMFRAITNSIKTLSATAFETTVNVANAGIYLYGKVNSRFAVKDYMNAFIASDFTNNMSEEDFDKYKQAVNRGDTRSQLKIINKAGEEVLSLINAKAETLSNVQKEVIARFREFEQKHKEMKAFLQNATIAGAYAQGRNEYESTVYNVMKMFADISMSYGSGVILLQGLKVAGLARVGALSPYINKYAESLGAIGHWQGLTYHSVMRDMVAGGKHESEARIFALPIAIITGALDRLESNITLGLSSNLLKLATGMARKTLANRAKLYGVSVFKEEVIETLQGLTEEIGKYLASEMRGGDKDEEEISKELKELLGKYNTPTDDNEIYQLALEIKKAKANKTTYVGNATFLDVWNGTVLQAVEAAKIIPFVVLIGQRAGGMGGKIRSIQQQYRETVRRLLLDQSMTSIDLKQKINELTKDNKTATPEVIALNNASIESLNANINTIEETIKYIKSVNQEWNTGLDAQSASAKLKSYMRFNVNGEAGLALQRAIAEKAGIDIKTMSSEEMQALADASDDVVFLDEQDIVTNDKGEQVYSLDGKEHPVELFNGYFDKTTGKIYVNTKRLNESRAQEDFLKNVVKHEFFHHGLFGMDAKARASMLSDTFNSMTDAQKQSTADTYKNQLRHSGIKADGSMDMESPLIEDGADGIYNNELIAEEFLAKQSEKITSFIKTSLGRRVVKSFKAILRKFGRSVNFSDAEIAEMIMKIRNTTNPVVQANVNAYNDERAKAKELEDEATVVKDSDVDGVKYSIPRQYEIDGIKYDQTDGIGQVTYNYFIHKVGFKKYLTPAQFINLVPEGQTFPQNVLKFKKLISNGVPIASPFLEVTWNDFSNTWDVWAHEGRSRVSAIQFLNPNAMIEVHIIPPQKTGMENVTEEMKNAPIRSEKTKIIYDYNNPTPEIKYANTDEVRYSIPESTIASYNDAVSSNDLVKAGEIVREAASIAMPNTKVVDKDGKPMVAYKGMMEYDWETGNKINIIDSKNGKWAGFFTNKKDVAQKFKDAFATMGKSVLLKTYLNITNPFIIDAYGKQARDFMFDNTVFGKMAIRKDLLDIFEKDTVYDGVVIKNTLDEGDVFIPKFSSQIKSAEPITKDDAGNVIPIEKRFSQSDDIRYSVAGDSEENKLYSTEFANDYQNSIQKAKEKFLQNSVLEKTYTNGQTEGVLAISTKKDNTLQYSRFSQDGEAFGDSEYDMTNEGLNRAILDNRLHQQFKRKDIPITAAMGKLANFIHTYKLRLRDVGIGTYPDPQSAKVIDSRTIEYPYLLSQEQIDKFELSPVSVIEVTGGGDVRYSLATDEKASKDTIQVAGTLTEEQLNAQDLINKIEAQRDVALADMDNATFPDMKGDGVVGSFKGAYQERWPAMSEADKKRVIDDFYDKKVNAIILESNLLDGEDSLDMTHQKIVEYISTIISKPLYIGKVYKTSDKNVLIIEILSTLDENLREYLRFGTESQARDGENVIIDGADSSLTINIQATIDTVFSDKIDMKPVKAKLAEIMTETLTDADIETIITSEQNVTATISALIKELGYNKVVAKVSDLLKKIQRNKYSIKSIISPDQRRSKLPPMTLNILMAGMVRSRKGGIDDTIDIAKHNKELLDNTIEFIEENISLERVKAFLIGKLREINVARKGDEQDYLDRVNTVLDNYNKLIDNSLSIQQNIERASANINELLVEQDSATQIFKRTLLNQLAAIQANMYLSQVENRPTNRIEHIVAMAEAYNSNNTEMASNGILYDALVLERFNSAKMTAEEYVVNSIQRISDYLQNYHEDADIRNDAIRALRLLARLKASKESVINNQVTAVASRINNTVTAKNVKIAHRRMIKVLKSIKSMGVRANAYHDMFVRILSLLPINTTRKDLASTQDNIVFDAELVKEISMQLQVATGEYETAEDAIDAINKDASLEDKERIRQMQAQKISDNPEYIENLKVLQVAFNNLIENGVLQVNGKSPVDLMTITNVLDFLGTRAGDAYKSVIDARRRNMQAIDNSWSAQIATRMIDVQKNLFGGYAIADLGVSFLNTMAKSIQTSIAKRQKYQDAIAKQIAKLEPKAETDKDIEVVDSLKSELATLQSTDYNEMYDSINSILGNEKSAKTFDDMSQEELENLIKALKLESDNKYYYNEEFLDNVSRTLEDLASVLTEINSIMKSKGKSFIEAVQLLQGDNLKLSASKQMAVEKLLTGKPIRNWDAQDFKDFSLLIDNLLKLPAIGKTEEYIALQNTQTNLFNYFSQTVASVNKNLSSNFWAKLNAIPASAANLVGLDSSVIANIITVDEKGDIYNLLYRAFQLAESKAGSIVNSFTKGFYHSLPAEITVAFSEDKVEAMSQYFTSVGYLDKHRNYFARITPNKSKSAIKEVTRKLFEKLAAVKFNEVKLITNTGVTKSNEKQKMLASSDPAQVKAANDINVSLENNDYQMVKMTDSEKMMVYAMMYVDRFNSQDLQLVREDSKGIVIDHGLGTINPTGHQAPKNYAFEQTFAPLNKANADEIVAGLSDAQKQYVELLIEKYNAEISPEMRNEYQKATGKAMKVYGKYLPIRRYIGSNKDANEDGTNLSGEWSMGGGLSIDSARVLKEKQENSTAPLLITDFFGVMSEAIQFSANYIAYRKPLEDLSNVTSSQNINNFLIQIPGYGKAMSEQLNIFEKRITGQIRNTNASFGWLDNFISNVVQVNLFAGFKSILSQLASMPMAIRYGVVGQDNVLDSAGVADVQQMGMALMRASNLAQDGTLPVIRKDEEYLLNELSENAGDIYNRIISGFVNGIINNNPDNIDLTNDLVGHRKGINRVLALQYYMDRASMSQLALSSIEVEMKRAKIEYGLAMNIAKYKSLSRDNPKLLINKKINEEELDKLNEELTKINNQLVNTTTLTKEKVAEYKNRKADLSNDIKRRNIILAQMEKDIAGLKTAQGVIAHFKDNDNIDVIAKYEQALAIAIDRIRMQFETQSMTSVLYTPPISDYRALRAWLPLAYRNSWNRRFITLRNRYNIVRNKYLRGDKTAFDAMTNMLVQESTNSVISGVYMALVEALCQSLFYDWEENKYKQEFMGRGFAARAKVKGNSSRFLLQAFANIIFANSSIFPGLNESLLYGFNVGMGTPNAQFSANGILTSKFPALSQIARFWDKRVVNYKAFRALAGFIEVLAPIPANQLLNFGAGAIYGYDVMWHYLMDLPIPIINNVFPVDKNGKRIINPDGTYQINAIEDDKFMKQIKDLQNSDDVLDKSQAKSLLRSYNRLKEFNANTKSFSDKTVAFADANAIRIAESLFQQRDAIAKLTTAYEAGKRQIAPYLKVEPVVIPGQGSIFFVNGSVSNRLDGDKVLAGLTKIAKVSPDIAKALLKRWSNVRTMSQYVKISNKDNITTGA